MLLERALDIEEFIKQISRQPAFAFDTETFGLLDRRIKACSFAWDGAKYSAIFDRPEQGTWFLKKIQDQFLDPEKFVVMHNSKFDINVLNIAKIDFKAKIWDTQIAAFLLDENKHRGGYKLDALSRYYLKAGKPEPWSADLYLPENRARLVEYAERDPVMTWGLKKIFEPELHKEDLWYAFRVDCAVAHELLKMETRGFQIDREYLEILDKRITWIKFCIESDLYRCAGKKLNLNSGTQVAKFLYGPISEGGLALVPKKEHLTKSGKLKTSESALEEVMHLHPFVKRIVEYRKCTKTHGTYVIGMLEKLDADNRLHTNMNITATVTGRLSSSKPNLQNIPRPGEDRFRIREAFIAKPGYVLLDADESQLELRIMAHRSGDPLMLKAFRAGLDIHQVTADNLHISRQHAKTVNFGLIYGLSASSLAADLGISKRAAQKYLDDFFEVYGGIRRYVDKVVRDSRMSGYSRTMSGRKRRLISINSEDFKHRGHAERQAVNTSIQGSASDILKRIQLNLGMVLVEDECDMILQVHDELLFECRKDLVEHYSPIIKHHMEHPFPKDLLCPLHVDVKKVTKWAYAK